MPTKINIYKQSGTDVDTRVNFNVPRSLTYGLNARANDNGGVTESDNCEYNTLNALYGINYEPIPIQPETAAYLAFTGITGTTEVNAINKLVYELKQNNLWSKMKAVYPFVTDNKNLLSYTNTLTNVYWQKSQVILTSGQSDPNGGTNATQLAGSSATNAYLFGSATTVIGQTYTASVYIKGDTNGSVSFRVDTGSGTLSNPINYTTSWQRFTYTFTSLSVNADWVIGGYNTWTGAETIYVYAPQLELSSTATTYQPIITTQQEYISTQFKYNLIDGFNFKLVFNGGWVHSSTGATPNGVNGYADTQFNPSVSSQLNSAHISYYSRTNSNATEVELGVERPSGNYQLLEIRTAGLTYFYMNQSSGLGIADANSLGYYVANRTASNVVNGFKNGTKINNATTLSNALPNGNMYLAAYNQNSGAAFSFSTKQTAFATIGDGLTDTEAAILYSIVQQYQTFLNRQIP